MIYGLDSTTPPSVAQAQQMFALGWRWYICYVGGPRAAAGHHGWPNAAVAHVASAGFKFMPTYVGRTIPFDNAAAFTFAQGVTDGDEANQLTRACGFDKGTLLALDSEQVNWAANQAGVREYVRGWVQQVNAAGHPAYLYTDPETAKHFDSSLVDGLWVASFRDNSFSQAPPSGRFDPQTPPPWDAWQYSGDAGQIAGLAVDLNSARADLPFATYTLPG